MINDLPQFVPQDACLACDGCCRFAEPGSSWCPKMAREEIDGRGVFAEMVLKGLGEQDAVKTLERQGQFYCAFFRPERNMCRIYECRPFECRIYPFLLVKEGNSPAVGVHMGCPYVRENRQNNIFGDYVRTLQWYFQQDEVLGFLGRNPMLIGDYSGDERDIDRLFTLPLSNR